MVCYYFVISLLSCSSCPNVYVDVDSFPLPGTEKKTKHCEFKSGDQEPWVYRGGILGEFRVRVF